MGLAWMMYMSTTGNAIKFVNEGIQYQMPLLLIVVVTKYISLLINRFKTSKKLFYTNVVNYALYLLFVVLIDYRQDFFGSGAKVDASSKP